MTSKTAEKELKELIEACTHAYAMIVELTEYVTLSEITTPIKALYVNGFVHFFSQHCNVREAGFTERRCSKG